MFHTATNSVFLGLLASIVLGFLSPAEAKDAIAEIKSLEKAETLPAFTYKDADRKTQDFKLEADKITIVHFWATWCVPCVKELPEVDALAKANPNVQILALSLDGKNTERVKNFYKDHKIATLKIATDEDMIAFRLLAGRVLPTTFFIKDGKIFARADGTVDWKDEKTKAALKP